MATPFTVQLQGGGSMVVNASDQAAAEDNVRSSGNTPVVGSASGQVAAAPASSNAGSTASTTTGAPSSSLGTIANAMTSALASGNKAAFDEAVREYNVSFGLDQQKYQAQVDQYNQSLGVSVAGLTGTYQGQQTLAGQQQGLTNAATVAGLTGVYTAPGATPGAATVPNAPTTADFLRQPADVQASYTTYHGAAAAAADWVRDATAAMVKAGGGQAAGGATAIAGTQTLASIKQQADIVAQQAATAQAATTQNNTATQQYLTLIAGLKGPQDYGNYLRTIGSTPNGLSDLVASASGQYRPASGATTGVAPQGATLGGLMNAGATGVSGAAPAAAAAAGGGTTYADYMQQAAALPPPNQISPAAWNAYTDSQKQMLTGMYGQQGYTTQDVADLYKQSLPTYAYQGNPTGAIKLA
jgi:hypothetical protein